MVYRQPTSTLAGYAKKARELCMEHEAMVLIAKAMAAVERKIDSGELSYCRVDGLDGIRLPLRHDIAAEFGIERGQTISTVLAKMLDVRYNAELEADLAILKAKQEKPE